MYRKIQLFLICIFFLTVFICNTRPLQANEGSPPVPAGAPAQVNQGVAPGKESAVVMDPNARAVIPSDSFDFGSAYEGNDIYHDFIIKNEGTAELKIISVKSG
jgi:hypothetical protein